MSLDGNSLIPFCLFLDSDFTLPTLLRAAAHATFEFRMSLDRVHPASLIPRSLHDPDFTELMRRPVDMKMVTYVAQTVERTIFIEDSASEGSKADSALPTPPQTPHRASKSSPSSPDENENGYCSDAIPSLENFIVHLVQSSNVQVGTLLTTVIYLQRLRVKLPPMSKGALCVFPVDFEITYFYICRHPLYETPCFLSHAHCRRQIPARFISQKQALGDLR